MRYLPYESLHDLYVNKLWPEKKIAQHFNCSHYIVRRNIAYYGFPSGRLERQNKMTYEELKNYLIKLHQKDGLSVSEIAKQINGSENQIRRYLHKFQVYQKKEHRFQNRNYESCIRKNIGQYRTSPNILTPAFPTSIEC